ncbi:MAG: putative baseplate assembly protein, partial [Chloroflexi bacterium]|nr:putative baseplate assembly protein [Chloroflexota bacterium]
GLARDNLRIEGGERVKDIQLSADPVTNDNVLTVTVNTPGDFSTYTLRLVRSQEEPAPPAGFDPQLSAVDFSFKVTCPNDFDCLPEQVCPPELTAEPEINYLAKDYASFRRLMLDRLAILLPEWRARNPADLGVTLVELLAYTADYLSYQQDAVATEAYLSTARRRVSVRRHARLVDYFMHDGCNARAWVQVRVSKDAHQVGPDQPLLPRGTQLLTQAPGLAPRIRPDSAEFEKALATGAQVFELMQPVADLYVGHNEIKFYTWGERQCCLPKGATRATLNGTLANLKAGDVLIFIEVRGPQSGEQEDADPDHRCAVRLTKVQAQQTNGDPLTDPLNDQPVTEIEWHAEDALPFPLCLSAGVDIDDVSLALGNIVLADHGRTITDPEDLGAVPRPRLVRAAAEIPAGVSGRPLSGLFAGSASNALQRGQLESILPRYRPRLKESPLTQAARYPYLDDEEPLKPAQAAMQWRMAEVIPAVTRLESALDSTSETWTVQRDLLSSGPEKRDFVVEVEAGGSASLRFGDGRHGFRPPEEMRFRAVYRVGNGTAGNVGRGAITHIVSTVADIESVSNPLAARGGIELESIERVRQNAPVAFRTQERAVTLQDYATIAGGNAEVQRAAASLRWTGSWHTVFLTVDRLGGLVVGADFEDRLRSYLEPYRMINHDLEIDSPRFVPLEIEIQVCARPDYFNSDVKAALLEVFSNRTLPGEKKGVFHPDNFTFGQPVFLSTLYAAAEAVPGVASVEITRCQRQDQPSDVALKSGQLAIGRLEIAQLDNDPNFPKRGVFRLTVRGGK